MLLSNLIKEKICNDNNEQLCWKQKNMDIFKSFKNLIKRVDEVDTKSKKMSREKCYSSNPFAFQQNKTYAWVERAKTIDKCGRVEPKE